ncbi:hypothetical protein AR505_1253 [methanogenic archaeon ISO4-H5]|nr:hypothetical protein AR505_1253 [methanogenic archaeon ISO4-H5]
MVQHVHICPVGFYPEPILAAVGALPADKYYFLYNEHEESLKCLEAVKTALAAIGQNNNMEMDIDPFDYSAVVGTLMKIHHEERHQDPDTHFYINFTNGTNIVAGACCSVSYFIGATLYYVMRDEPGSNLSKTERVRIIKTPRIPDIEKMKPFAKDILSKICESKLGIEMQALSLYMQSSPQKLNHHINSFISSGLVEKTKDGRKVVLVATEQGKLLYSWIAEDAGF